MPVSILQAILLFIFWMSWFSMSSGAAESLAKIKILEITRQKELEKEILRCARYSAMSDVFKKSTAAWLLVIFISALFTLLKSWGC